MCILYWGYIAELGMLLYLVDLGMLLLILDTATPSHSPANIYNGRIRLGRDRLVVSFFFKLAENTLDQFNHNHRHHDP